MCVLVIASSYMCCACSSGAAKHFKEHMRTRAATQGGGQRERGGGALGWEPPDKWDDGPLCHRVCEMCVHYLLYNVMGDRKVPEALYMLLLPVVV